MTSHSLQNNSETNGAKSEISIERMIIPMVPLIPTKESQITWRELRHKMKKNNKHLQWS